MIKVGITGGIGSGKTTVCRVFELLGVPVYYSDIEAREIINQDIKVVNSIKRVFGEDSYVDGVLNRAYISSIVFGDQEKLEQLNAITHPAVARHFSQWLQGQNANYIIKEAAILFESGAYKTVDHIITVTAPLDLRLSRVMERDNFSKAQVLERISKQMNESEKIARADDVIYADDKRLVITQILEIDKKIRYNEEI